MQCSLDMSQINRRTTVAHLPTKDNSLLSPLPN